MSPHGLIAGLTVASILGVVIRVTHKPRNDLDLSPEARRKLRELETQQDIMRAKARKESK